MAQIRANTWSQPLGCALELALVELAHVVLEEPALRWAGRPPETCEASWGGGAIFTESLGPSVRKQGP